MIVEKALFMYNIVLGIGRCNPPTKGHEKVINTILRFSKKDMKPEFHIVDGEQTSKNKDKNPLTGEYRKEILKLCFPEVKFEIVSSAYESMAILEVQNKFPKVLVTGSDRVANYEKLLKYANFDKTEIIGLDREKGSLANVSATAAKLAVIQNNFEDFKNMMPSQLNLEQIFEIYENIRKAICGDRLYKISNSTNN
jgi:hypothetical protein